MPHGGDGAIGSTVSKRNPRGWPRGQRL